MPDRKSLLLILGGDASLVGQVEDLLPVSAWVCRVAADLPAALTILRAEVAAALLVDARAHGAASVISAVRQLPAPGNSTPILVSDDSTAELRGAGGHLTSPLDSHQFLASLRHWAGPLEDAELRAIPLGPRYKLIRLVGFDNAEAMLTRFRSALMEAIETAQHDACQVPAHRLAGLAGMMGFAELSRLWADADRGAQDGLMLAVQASKAILPMI